LCGELKLGDSENKEEKEKNGLGGICKGLECNPIRIGGHIGHIEYDERYL
jgi:hypothetical protein